MKFVSFVCNLQRALNNWAFKFKGLYFVILAVITCNGLKNLRGFSDGCQYKIPKLTLALLIFLCLPPIIIGGKKRKKTNKRQQGGWGEERQKKQTRELNVLKILHKTKQFLAPLLSNLSLLILHPCLIPYCCITLSTKAHWGVVLSF